MQHLYASPTARRSLFAMAFFASLMTLAGCSRTEESPPKSAPATTPAASAEPTFLDAYSRVAQQTKGFTVGPLMSANAVYVLFDPQCPHCGHLWQAAQPLLQKTKFVWVPVSIINAKSMPQGAALLTAAKPAEAMTAHENSILAGTGGTSAPSSVAPEIEAALKANNQVFNALKGESVPMIIARNAKTGSIVTRMGALETAALAEFLGVAQP